MARKDESKKKTEGTRRKGLPILLEDLLPGEDVKGGARETRKKRVFGAAEETERQDRP